MERLTKRIDENHACFAICEKECPDGIYADNPACMCTAGRAALKKLVRYEDTGLTPEQILELKERDTAKETIKDTDSGVRYTDDYICPNCGKHFTGTGIAEFCYHCGQRLKWDE